MHYTANQLQESTMFFFKDQMGQSSIVPIKANKAKVAKYTYLLDTCRRTVGCSTGLRARGHLSPLPSWYTHCGHTRQGCI